MGEIVQKERLRTRGQQSPPHNDTNSSNKVQAPDKPTVNPLPYQRIASTIILNKIQDHMSLSSPNTNAKRINKEKEKINKIRYNLRKEIQGRN